MGGYICTHIHTLLPFCPLDCLSVDEHLGCFILGHLLTSLHVDIGFVSPRHVVKFTFIENDPGRKVIFEVIGCLQASVCGVSSAESPSAQYRETKPDLSHLQPGKPRQFSQETFKVSGKGSWFQRKLPNPKGFQSIYLSYPAWKADIISENRVAFL